MILIEQLRRYFLSRPDAWHAKAALTRMEWRNFKDRTNYSPENVGRRLRELEEESYICIRYTGGNGEYRLIPNNWKHRYIPANKRPPYSNNMWQPPETKTLSML